MLLTLAFNCEYILRVLRMPQVAYGQRARRNICMKSGCFGRPNRKIFSLRGPTMVGRAASRPEVGLERFSKYSMFLRHLLGFRVLYVCITV